MNSEMRFVDGNVLMFVFCFSAFEMPIINKSYTCDAAMTECQKIFTTTTLDELMDPDSEEEYTKLPCVLLHTKKAVKNIIKVSYRPFASSGGASAPKMRPPAEASYEMFVLLGVAGSDQTVAIYTEPKSSNTQVLLQYSSHLHPGCHLLLLAAEFDGSYITGTDTPVVSSMEPLIPSVLFQKQMIIPNGFGSTDFRHFSLLTDDLEVRQVHAIGKVC